MKQYSLSSIAVKGGTRGSWTSNTWTNYHATTDSSCRIGRYKSTTTNYATYFMFDPAVLTTLRGKTVTKITLAIVAISGSIPSATTTTLPVGYKYNNSLGSSDNDNTWARSDSGSTAINATNIGYFRNATGGATTADRTLVEIDLTGTTIPVYGYVIGPRDENVGGYLTLANTATLIVETDETASFTVTYDANGGSGAPASQTKEAGVDITLSSAEPLRSGYIFTEWNTAQDGTGANYAMGATFSLDADTTLYAQWSQITQTGVWIKGSDNTMHQGTVWVKGSDNAMHEASVYIKGSDNAMHQSS